MCNKDDQYIIDTCSYREYDKQLVLVCIHVDDNTNHSLEVVFGMQYVLCFKCINRLANFLMFLA